MVLRRWALLLLLAACVCGTAAHAQDVGWQEAVARLAQERTRAETCVALLKKHGDAAAKDRGALAYGEARAEYDGIIALSDPDADTDRTGLISPSGLAHYVARRVASLTGGRQTPEMEIRYDTTVFAVGR